MVEFVLDGNIIETPLGWRDIVVNASFEENIQPDISVTELTFGLDSCSLIKDWLSNNGYFRGMPLVIKKQGVNIFDGYLDFKERYIELHTGKIIVAIKPKESLNELSDKIEGYTFGLLQTQVNLQYVNVPYVVEKKNTFLEVALVSITTLLLLKELYESIVRLGKILKALTKATIPLATASEILGVALQILIDLAYTISMVIALKNLIEDLLSNLISPVRFHKSINVKSALTSFFTQVGYAGFESGISELDNLYYIPSKEQDVKSGGIPNTLDNGYLLSEFIQIIRNAFNAKLVVDSNNKIQLRSENDPYFIRNSNYTMDDILLESSQYNTSDLKGTYKLNFSTDVNDEWTITNYTGTAYEVYTSSTNNNGTNLVNGITEVGLPVCLGSRKDGLNTLESLLRGLAGLADKVINAIGGSSNLSGKVTARIGMLKVAQENWAVPKLLLLNNQYKLNANSVNSWSSKVLYNKYHSYNSFVTNKKIKQREVFNGVQIPFCIEDYNKVLDNSYFTTRNNKIGKFTSLKMVIDGNKATADFWISEVYDTNLKETYVEP